MKTIHLILLFSLFLSLNAAAQQWQEVTPHQYATLHIYQGPTYADQAFKQQGQSLGVNISDIGAGLIQKVKYRLPMRN